MKRTLVLVVWALCLAVPIAAEWKSYPFPTQLYTVRGLMDACDPPADYPLRWRYEDFCVGYLSASMDWIGRERGKQLLRSVLDRESMICSSLAGKTVGQVRAVFLKWGKEHPELWDKDRMDGVHAAISEAWPCGQPSEDTDKP